MTSYPICRLKSFPRLPEEILGLNGIFSHALAKMYFDDWFQGVIPYVNEVTFDAEVRPTNQRQTFINLINGGKTSSRDTQNSLREFFEKVVQLIILDGGAAFEICAHDDSADVLILNDVSFTSLTVDGDQITQKLPNSPNRIAVPIEEMFILETPEWIEGGRGFDITIAKLVEESKRDSAPFPFLMNRNGKTDSLFNYSTYRNMHVQRSLSATRHSGWAGRFLYTEHLTDFYSTLRMLKFRANQIRLREWIVERINIDLLPKLKKFAVDIDTFTLTGLPSSQQLEKLILKLQEGEIGFLEAVKESQKYS